MILANGPVDTAPCDAVANVINTIAMIALHPVKANAHTNKPLTINDIDPAILRTCVRDMRLVSSNQSPSVENPYANTIRAICGMPHINPVVLTLHPWIILK